MVDYNRNSNDRCGRTKVRVEMRTLVGTVAGISRDVKLRDRSANWFRFAQLAATYLVLVVFVVPLHFTSLAGSSAQRIHKAGNRQRRKVGPAVESESTSLPSEDRNANDEEVTPIVAFANRNCCCLPDRRTAPLFQQLVTLPPVFRPLRC